MRNAECGMRSRRAGTTIIMVVMLLVLIVGCGAPTSCIAQGSVQDYAQYGNLGLCQYDSVVMMTGIPKRLIRFWLGGKLTNDVYLTPNDTTIVDLLQGGNIARVGIKLNPLGAADSVELDCCWVLYYPDVKPTWGPHRNIDGSSVIVDSLATTNDTYGVAGIWRFNPRRDTLWYDYKLPLWFGRGTYEIWGKQHAGFLDTNAVRSMIFKAKI